MLNWLVHHATLGSKWLTDISKKGLLAVVQNINVCNMNPDTQKFIDHLSAVKE